MLVYYCEGEFIPPKLLFLYSNIYMYLSSLFLFSGVSGFPQDLKQVYNDPKTGRVIFGWKKLECERMNGVLLGYEVKLYYDEETCTERVIESVTSFAISPQCKPRIPLPIAISVAAINEVGVGDHSPPVKINSSG